MRSCQIQAHAIEIGKWAAQHDAGGAHRVRDAVGPWELVEASDGVHCNGQEVGPNTFELVIGVDVANGEASSVVNMYDGLELAQDGLLGSVGNGSHGAKTDVAKYGVQVRKPLHKKEIRAQQGDSSMMLQERSRDWHCFESRGPGCCMCSRCLSFDGCDVGAVDEDGPSGIVGRDRAITN